jgi:hypothetical protein
MTDHTPVIFPALRYRDHASTAPATSRATFGRLAPTTLTPGNSRAGAAPALGRLRRGLELGSIMYSIERSLSAADAHGVGQGFR